MELNLDFFNLTNPDNRLVIDDTDVTATIETSENTQPEQPEKQQPQSNEQKKSTSNKQQYEEELIVVNSDDDVEEKEVIDNSGNKQTNNIQNNQNIKNEKVNNPTSFNGYAATLKEAGIIDLDLDEFSKLPVSEQTQKLLEVTDNTIANRASEIHSEYLKSLPDKIRNILSNYEEGLPIEKAIEHTSRLDVYKDYERNLDNEEIAKKILIEEKINNGLTKEEAIEEVDAILEPTKIAKSSIRRLIKSEEVKAEKEKIAQQEQVKQQQEFQKKQIEKFNEFVDKTDELIKGFQLNKKDKEAVKSLMLNPTSKDQNGNPLTKMLEDRSKNPLEFDTKIAFLYHITKGFTTLDRFVNTSKSAAIKTLEQELEKSTLNSGNSYEVTNTQSNEDLEAKINSFNSFLQKRKY